MRAKDVLLKKIKNELEIFQYESCDNCYWGYNNYLGCNNNEHKKGKIWITTKCDKFMLCKKVIDGVAEKILSLVEKYDNGKIKRPKSKPMPTKEDDYDSK